MSSKTAIVILSDPSTGTDEALGRVFDGLATAWEYAQNGEALVLFQGTATRWPAVLADSAHPAHELYTAVKGQIATVASSGCTTVFGAGEGIEAEGIKQVGQNHAPGTPGVASIFQLEQEGYRILTF